MNIRRPAAAVAAVALVYALAQLALVGIDREPEWDEAVYITQVAPDAPAADFAAHRARGMTLVIAPTAAAGLDTSATRLLLVVVSSVLLATAFGAWIPLIGWAAPLAAGLFAATWMSLFYGSAVSPNLFGALLAVLAIGLVLRHTLQPATVLVVGAASMIGALTLLRPLDGAMTLVVAIGVVWWKARTEFARRTAALVAGFFAGTLPWIVEAFARFGDPFQRLEYARGPVDAGPTFTVFEHLRMLDGRALVGPDPTQTVSRGALLALLVGIGLGVVAIISARSSARSRSAVVVGAGGAILLALPYLVWVGATAPRFLFPAFALAAIPTGIGLLAIIKNGNRIALAGMIVLLAVVITWHVDQVRAVDHRETVAAQERHDVGVVLAEASDGPCAFASQFGYPQVQLASGCHGLRFDPADPEAAYEFLRGSHSEGFDSYLAVTSEPAGLLEQGEWAPMPTGVGSWTIYQYLGAEG